ncbi:ATP-grasp domain-containing protein [Streptomyces sp. NPDC007971]|uniref:ATP-grasp domain-containing protein n=1 Tax=Streptomyces sp. NPDC007971 TaxID=3364799 RepID=UPI0036E2785D
MDTYRGNTPAGVLVIEPMGNAGRFLVEAAHQLGISLYAATHKDIYDTYPAWLSGALTDVCFTDLTDTGRALADMKAFCLSRPVTAVGVCWELLSHLAAPLAAMLNLPGNDPLVAQAPRNKIVMAEAFHTSGVPAPRWAPARDAEHAHRVAASHGLGWPLVVKPAEQGGSWGVRVVDGPDQLTDAVHAAQQFARALPHGLPLDRRVLIQEYVPGDEYSADTVVVGGVPYPLPVVRKDTTPGRYRIETGHTCPAGIPPSLLRRIQHTAARAALAVGIRNGIAHTELKLTPRAVDPVVIETGARLPGGNICELVEAATGISEAAAYLQAIAGQIPDTAPTRQQAAAIRFVLAPHAGTLQDIRIPPTPGTRHELHLTPGQYVNGPADSSARLAHIIATATHSAEAARLAEQAAARTIVKVS